MSQILINIGTIANDGTGDTLRGAFANTNNNFTELYSHNTNVSANIVSVAVASNAWTNVVSVATNSYTIQVGAASNTWANNVGIAGNNYSIQVGAASNTWANNVGTAGNNYTNAVGVAGNNYTNAVGVAGNSYSVQVSAASNTWANNVGIAGNNYTNAVGTAGNNYTNAVGTAGNNYTIQVGAASNTWSNNVGVAANTWANNIGTVGNSYSIQVGAASNTWANNIGAAGNNYTDAVGTAGNNYTISVGTAGNNYAIQVGAAANNWANTLLTQIDNTDTLIWDHANAAFDKANSSLQNTSFTLNGSLTANEFIDISGRVRDQVVYISNADFNIVFVSNFLVSNTSNLNYVYVLEDSYFTPGVGTKVSVLQYGTGKTIIAPNTANVKIYSANGLNLSSQYAVAELVKIASNNWIAYGSLSTA